VPNNKACCSRVFTRKGTCAAARVAFSTISRQRRIGWVRPV
jgi:hypothetical protein